MDYDKTISEAQSADLTAVPFLFFCSYAAAKKW